MTEHGKGREKAPGTARCQEILKDLANVLKALNFYPGRNQAVRNLLIKLHEAFRCFLDEYGEMRLNVEGGSFFYEGEEVFSGPDRGSMAFLLSAAGIKGFVFKKGFEKEELEALVDALNRCSTRENRRDLIALLWREELRHIEYSVPKEFFIEKGVHALPGGPEKERFFAVRGGRGIFDIVLESFRTGIEALPLTPEELEVIKGGLDVMERDVLIEFITDMLLKLLQKQKEQRAADEKNKNILPVYSKILATLARSLMEKNDTRGVLELLKKLCALCGGRQSEHFSKLPKSGGRQDRGFDAVEKAIGELASMEAANWFLNTSGSRMEIEKYLFLISPFKVETLLGLLAECQDRRTRKVICNILAFIAPQKLQDIGRYLYDDRWYVVRNIVSVLGMSGNRMATALIKKASSHHSAKVRRECVKAFEALPSAGTFAPLTELLSDEEGAVRISALKALARKFSAAAELFGVIEKAISGADFPGRPFEEKREFLGAYGLIGGERSFPLLRDTFSRRGLMAWYDQDELRAASAFGLAHIPLAEAASMLEKGARSRVGLLRESCLAAIETRQKKFSYSRKMDELRG